MCFVSRLIHYYTPPVLSFLAFAIFLFNTLFIYRRTLYFRVCFRVPFFIVVYCLHDPSSWTNGFPLTFLHPQHLDVIIKSHPFLPPLPLLPPSPYASLSLPFPFTSLKPMPFYLPTYLPTFSTLALSPTQSPLPFHLHRRAHPCPFVDQCPFFLSGISS